MSLERKIRPGLIIYDNRIRQELVGSFPTYSGPDSCFKDSGEIQAGSDRFVSGRRWFPVQSGVGSDLFRQDPQVGLNVLGNDTFYFLFQFLLWLQRASADTFAYLY